MVGLNKRQLVGTVPGSGEGGSQAPADEGQNWWVSKDCKVEKALRKQPRCPDIDAWRRKVWYRYTMK